MPSRMSDSTRNEEAGGIGLVHSGREGGTREVLEDEHGEANRHGNEDASAAFDGNEVHLRFEPTTRKIRAVHSR